MVSGPERRRELRLELRDRRATLDEGDQAAASMAVMARLAAAPVLRDASLVSGYRAVRGELDIDAALLLLRERGATITVPRVVGEDLVFTVWDPTVEGVVGAFGIPEPTPGPAFPLRAHDVVLLPVVAFDGRGNRLGQGGGYYDRALGALGEQRPPVVGVAHTFQEVESVPTEPWDIRLDAIVTEDGLRDFA